ncbi:hypothetical protein BBF96_15105 [Anoxybacter fermentans]|uniref:MobA-like NTP transferase domain-containing protein n=1 Tax=Anoxybacter fermentans TaxID=1323375 RepID=A0A3S9T1Z6_9FIRM|nr:nucleotidyltransferase family protein [Anoxybacter fermentans]AZR74584.1 hypothetical protein BBF96_15105 [Anoxybacter fermentans]
MIMGVILAAGEAKRMGEPKQLLSWQGEPLIRWVIRQVWFSRFNPVRVVLGAYADQIEPLIEDLDVEILFNPAYPQGQSTSVKKGLQDYPPGVIGAAFILGDQPLIKVETYNYLIEVFEKEEPGILVPTYQNQRGNPIFFHKRFFSDLMKIEGDCGGREIIFDNQAQVRKVEVADPGIILDLDVKEDYLRLMKMGEVR